MESQTPKLGIYKLYRERIVDILNKTLKLDLVRYNYFLVFSISFFLLATAGSSGSFCLFSLFFSHDFSVPLHSLLLAHPFVGVLVGGGLGLPLVLLGCLLPGHVSLVAPCHNF